MQYKKEGFTLIELIVGITILTILSSIAYLSFQGYSQKSRDSVRKTDLNNIKLSLELYSIDKGKFPKPTNSHYIVYLGYLAWEQGIFGNDTRSLIGFLSNDPIDPLTGNDYTYSVSNGNNEYELASVFEKEYSYENKVINSSYAGNIEGETYITGKYNGKILKINTPDNFFILAIPSIINGNISSRELINIVNNKELAYNGFNQLPSSYSQTYFKNSGTFNYRPNKLILFSGSLSSLVNSKLEQVKVLKNIQYSYSGTILSTNKEFKRLLLENIDIVNPSIKNEQLAKNILKINSKNAIPISELVGSGPINSFIFSEKLPLGPTIVPDVIVSFNTNLKSECRFSSTDIDYNDMNSRFVTLDNYFHKFQYSPYGGINNLYLKCSEKDNNIHKSIISFEYLEGIIPVNIEFNENDWLEYTCNLCE